LQDNYTSQCHKARNRNELYTDQRIGLRIIIGSDRERLGLGLGLGSDRRSEPNIVLGLIVVQKCRKAIYLPRYYGGIYSCILCNPSHKKPHYATYISVGISPLAFILQDCILKKKDCTKFKFDAHVSHSKCYSCCSV